MSRPLLVVDDPLFDLHRSRGYHPERPERLEAARRGLARATEGRATTALAPRDATDDELARTHAPAHLEALATLAGRTGAVDADTFVAPDSIRAARRAAGGAVALVEALIRAGDEDDAPQRGVALLRPPGHHATPERAMGFCLFNNAAVAARAALARGVSRVAVVDWDVHHGNGTQDAFWTDPRVLYASLHQFPLYPGTGAADEVGEGEGRGYTVNVPLSADADDAVYAAAFDQLVVPVLDRFAPQLVIISAGYDAHERDPLGGMRLTERGYAAMTRALVAVANAHGRGRVALLLEGGYDLGALEASLAASIEALLEGAPEGSADARNDASIAAHHRAELEHARARAARHWRGL